MTDDWTKTIREALKECEGFKDKPFSDFNDEEWAKVHLLGNVALQNIRVLMEEREVLREALIKIEKEGQSYDTIEDCFLVARRALAWEPEK